MLGTPAVTDEVERRLAALTPKLRDGIEPLLLGAGVVQAVLLTPEGGSISESQDYITLVENRGVVGDKHDHPVAGVNVREDVLRHFMGFPKGTPMANLRQVTLTSREEGSEIASRMGLGVTVLQPGLQMENLVISGYPHLSQASPRTVVTFFAPTGEPRSASLHITAPNAPCGHPDVAIRSHYKIRTVTQPYATAADGLRGLVAMVKTGGPEAGNGGRVYPGDIALFWEHN